MLYLTIYLDGKTSECGYKYTITKSFSGWTACRNDNEFRYFLQNTGLKINPECTEIHDYSDGGKGRIITTAFYNREIDERLFWNMDEIPENAKQFVGLCNGSYVNCYTVIEADKTTIYRPNPNAKSVYLPYEYFEIVKRLEKGVFLNGYKNTFENINRYFD